MVAIEGEAGGDECRVEDEQRARPIELRRERIVGEARDGEMAGRRYDRAARGCGNPGRIAGGAPRGGDDHDRLFGFRRERDRRRHERDAGCEECCDGEITHKLGFRLNALSINCANERLIPGRIARSKQSQHHLKLPKRIG